jgi:hypothetical protein
VTTENLLDFSPSGPTLFEKIDGDGDENIYCDDQNTFPDDREYGYPRVANVGAHNDMFWANEAEAFGGNNYDYVKWYYNRNQQFREDYSKIKEVTLKNEGY